MNDYANLLRPAERDRLEARLAERERATGAQMAIAVFRSLEGENLEDFASRLFQRWRLGRKGLDNGVLLVVFVADRKLRLEVGYGLEPVVTDAVAAGIIRETIAPRFRARQWAAGLEGAVDAVYARIAPPRARGEQLGRDAEAWRRRQRESERAATVYGLAFLLLVAAVLGGPAWEASRSRGLTAGRRGWHRSSAWGGGWSGGGGWSSGSGGFSGGGGSSGGGGASGSW